MLKTTTTRAFLAAAALALSLSGCVITDTAAVPVVGVGVPTAPGAAAPAGNVPIINLFDASPKSVSSADQKVTFTVNVTVPGGAPAQYNWSSTLGTLSANTGQVVYWSPAGADGKVKAGSATVTVIVTANGQAVTGNANIIIKEDGSATVNVAPAAPAASAAPVASVAPSAVPTAAPSAKPEASATPVASPKPEASATAAPAATPAASPSADAKATPDAAASI